MYGNDNGVVDETQNELEQEIDNNMTSNNEHIENSTYDGYIKENYNTTGTYKDNITFGGFETKEEKPKKTFNVWLVVIPVLVVLILLLVLLASLSSGSGSSYTVKTKSISIKIGETADIKVKGKSKTLEKLTYSSANEDIATVNNSGTVTGVSEGNTKIWVGLNGKKSKSVNVVVTTNKTALIFKEENITLEKDSTYQLVIENKLSTDIYTWTSGNENVATVDENGLVTGIHGGSTHITVKESDGRKAKVKVTVTSDEILPERVSLSETSIGIGETYKLVPVVEPADAIKYYTWESSREAVATIDENGNITGIKEGTTMVTVTTHNGKSAKVKVTVDPKAVTSIKIDGCVKSLKVGDNVTLTAVIAPTTASKSVKWSSSNTKVLTVSDGKVTAKGTGSAVITATAKNGKTATCSISVGAMAVSSLKMSSTSITVNQGSTKALTVSFNPSSARDYYTVKWSSSNNSIATVDQNGVVTGISPGNATITATAGGKKATATVTVKKTGASSVSITNCPGTLTVNQKYTLKASSDYANASYKWSADYVDVATVSSNGLVTPKKVGVVTITVTSNGLEDTCTITVTDNLSISGCPSSSVEAGTVVNLTANVTSGSSVTWTSSNTNVATVSSGKVTTKTVGTSTITAKTTSGKTATCKITVIKPKITKINAITAITIAKGSSKTVTITTNLSATQMTTFYSSSDLTFSYSTSGIATATSTAANKFTVVGNKKGSTTIHVKIGGQSQTLQVTVTE